MRISGFTYEEYIWNVPLYSIFFFLRCSFILAFAFLINKYHQPLRARIQPRAWVPLSAFFPVCTLLVLRQVYTYSEEQRVWQICLLILNLVDIAFTLSQRTRPRSGRKYTGSESSICRAKKNDARLPGQLIDFI